MKYLPPILLATICIPLAACAAQVTHPTKSVAEMRVDIDRCTDRANDKYWMDPIAALYNAYDCLDAQGYQRGKAGLSAQVEKSLGEKKAARPKGQPCVVPCRR